MCVTVSQLRADVVPKTAGACIDDQMIVIDARRASTRLDATDDATARLTMRRAMMR